MKERLGIQKEKEKKRKMLKSGVERHKKKSVQSRKSHHDQVSSSSFILRHTIIHSLQSLDLHSKLFHERVLRNTERKRRRKIQKELKDIKMISREQHCHIREQPNNI